MKQNPYADIIDLPRPPSARHKMAMEDRAAQFSPFSALTGYDTAINETARLTDSRIEIDEFSKEVINQRLQLLQKHICNADYPTVNIVYFLADERKCGGSYEYVDAQIRKINEITKSVQTTDGLTILIEDIYKLEGEIFEQDEING